MPPLTLRFSTQKTYKSTNHEKILSMAKPEYHGKDFFQRSEFRGLLLADYQEAIGDKAFACVDQLNTNTVSQFSNLKSFREALNSKKQQEKFYKTSLVNTSKFSARGPSTTRDNSPQLTMGRPALRATSNQPLGF